MCNLKRSRLLKRQAVGRCVECVSTGSTYCPSAHRVQRSSVHVWWFGVNHCHFSGISWLQSSAEFSHRFALACKCLDWRGGSAVGFSSSVMRPSVSALITVGNVRRTVFPVRHKSTYPDIFHHYTKKYVLVSLYGQWTTVELPHTHYNIYTVIHLYCVSIRSYTSYESIVDFSVPIAFFIYRFLENLVTSQ